MCFCYGYNLTIIVIIVAREKTDSLSGPVALKAGSPSCGMILRDTLRPASLISFTMSACGMLTMDWPFTARILSPTFSFPQRSAGLPSMMRPILCGTAGGRSERLLRRAHAHSPSECVYSFWFCYSPLSLHKVPSSDVLACGRCTDVQRCV